jgi:hypothetical protein
MFLDDSNGQMTVTETSTVGEVSKPLAIVTKNSSEMVILTYRGEVISSNIQTNAPNDATYLTTTANGTLTAEVVVGSAPGGELGGTWASPTVDGTHSGSAHHADAHTVASHSDTTATGAELETLTDGSTTALHAHAVHHVEAHTVASHSDTTGTGAEVETLTDGSNAESLHTHTHTVVSHSDTTATGAELETLTDGSTTALHVHTIADDSIVEAKLDVSNGPTNGQFLQAQSGEGGGLTWAAAGGTTHTTGTTNVHVVNDATTGVTLNNDYKFTMVMPSSGEGFFFKCADQGSEQSALYYADYPSQITKIAGSSKWSVLNGGQTGSSSDGKFYVVSDANSRTITIFNREGNNRTITVHGMGRLASVTAQVAI